MGTGRSGVDGSRRGKRGIGRVHKFKSKAIDGFDYESDGGETAAFFRENSNVDELIDKMNKDERDSFETWGGGYFMSGQQYEGWDNMSERDRQLTKIYDKYLDQSVLDKGIEVRRLATAELVLGKGVKRVDSIEELKAMEGRVVTSKGSMSTGAAATGLTIGSDSKNVEYVFKLPKGAKGAGMWIGDRRINLWGDTQREFMMNRDTAFRVGKSKYNASRGVF